MRGHLSLLFAWRYLLSRKSLSVINKISRVSIFAVGVPVAAMVILLSVFNGLEGLVKGMYSSFDPDILVSPASGKVLDVESVNNAELHLVAGVEAASFVIDENVLLEYRGRQTIATLRGVDESYEAVVPIRDLMVYGDYKLRFGDMEQAIVGQGIAYNLSVRTSFYDPINIYVPKRGEFSSLLPVGAYDKGSVFPEGIFALDAETDGTFVITSMEFAQKLFKYDGIASKVMVKLLPDAKPEAARREISDRLGDEYKVQTRYEQKASMYRIMKYEKWGIFFIVFLVLVIASFSIVGSLVMLIIDKRPDIKTLMTMGAEVRFIRKIFIREGALIGVIGTVAGVAFGCLVCFIQQQFGIVKIGAQTFLIDSYPVLMRGADIVVIIVAALAVNWIITKFTVSKMIPKSSIRL